MGKLQDFLMESDIRTEKTEVQIAPFRSVCDPVDHRGREQGYPAELPESQF